MYARQKHVALLHKVSRNRVAERELEASTLAIIYVCQRSKILNYV
jgi:hypothetical protein